MAMPPKWSDNFLRETIRVWQPLSREPLTAADAHEICESMVGFFTVLKRIHDDATKQQSSSTDHSR